ncbi:5'-deoxynucleotidase YfbR [BD1-7 clade bacterium]|uniref:5'-deoxynucleotidase YfbR n=1 Tax=BD1-7 clade bacterium TaxID=2029982 RepID=A0A5S9MTU6_9GAMM|nr:5'-deoxynucleotidase YfbR [BD1-7 clade bacterium]CAA0083743.1 5'-deoxynucleotidase YfbR [BD1-7 clade bacterium]
MQSSRFFAYLGRLKWIKRWGLKRNVEEENVMEHSWQVATIAHALALIHNNDCGGNVDVDRVVTTALFHDVSEIITGDLPSPVKYYSDKIKNAYKEIEAVAEQELLSMVPEPLQPHYRHLLLHSEVPVTINRLVKGADLISAYQKCQTETHAGNTEFKTALDDLERRLRELDMPEITIFMSLFNEGYLMTLDELLAEHDRTHTR